MYKELEMPCGTKVVLEFDGLELENYFVNGGGDFPDMEAMVDDHTRDYTHIGRVTTNADNDGYEIDWQGGEDNYPGNWEDITDAVTVFLNDRELMLRNPGKEFILKRHIVELRDIIETMPDKGNSEEESQKVYLLNRLKEFERAVNGIVDEDWE